MDLASVETALREDLQVHSVESIEGFPYASYGDFLKARQVGQADVLTQYDPAAFGVLATPGHTATHYSLTWSPLVIAIALVVLAIVRADYVLLFGLPVALLGFMLSSPAFMRSIGSLVLILTTGAAFYNWYYANTTQACLWAAYAGVNFLTTVARRQCDMVVRDSVEKSEIVLVWLALKGTIIVQAKQ